MALSESSKICIHIGYHKTASSWIQVCAFHIHPAIAFINPPQNDFRDFWYKEAIETDDFSFNKEYIIDRMHQELSKKDISNKVLLISEENLSGHMYSGWNAKRNAERLFDLFGNCKIFIVIRNQVDYIVSAYSFYVYQYGAMSFKTWLNDYEIPVRTIYQKLCYDKLIEFYMKLFGSANVLVLPYEMIKLDGGVSLMKMFFAFINVEELEEKMFATIIREKVNVSLSPATLRLKRLVNGLMGENSPIQRRIFGVMDRFLLKHIPIQPPIMIKKQREDIQNFFRDSNQRTSKLIGIDLANYGYPV